VSDGFLSRWSRRKRGLEQQAPAPAAPAHPAPAVVEEEFDLASLPPLESLGAGSDLSAFLHAKVPALLRQAALRRVWAADPGIRDFTGPADYAWNYNDPNGVPGFALNLGDVDLKKLLAQAIGAPEETEAGTTEDSPAAPAHTEDEPMITEAPALPPPDDPVRLTEAPAVEPAPSAPAEVAEPMPQPVPRRHGGAMPRVG
jgi:hypothetical protein